MRFYLCNFADDQLPAPPHRHQNMMASIRADADPFRSHTSIEWSCYTRAVYLDKTIVPYILSKASGSTWTRFQEFLEEGFAGLFTLAMLMWRCFLSADVDRSKVHPMVTW
jgi:hypothetical protein